MLTYSNLANGGFTPSSAEPFQATHVACVLTLTRVQCSCRTVSLNPGVTPMYVVALMCPVLSRWCHIFCLSVISTATSNPSFELILTETEFCSWSSTPCMANRLAVGLFILLWLHLSWHYKCHTQQVAAWTKGRRCLFLAAQQQVP